MVGIESYGAYVPVYRLNREILNQVWGGGGKGEKAVANSDEDSLTMGVEAARDCLKGIEKNSIDALYFASTSFPFKEKQSASIMAAALDLSENVVTADIASSLMSGTIALKMALDAVKAGSANKVLVVAADCRVPYPNSAYEPILGDGAAAFLIGQDGVIAEIEGSHYITSEFIGDWRLEFDKGIKNWEDRFIREKGYMPYLQRAVSELMKAQSSEPKDFSNVVFAAANPGLHTAMARTLRVDPKTQVQDPMFNTVGNTGVAQVPMMLVSALEEAKAGDKILVANYGDGADAHILKVTEGIKELGERIGIKKNIASKLMLDNYGKYVKFRKLMEFAPGLDFAPRTSLPQIWRDRQWVYRFHGHKCTKCGKEQFPMQKACIYCQADGKFLEEIPLSDRKGTLTTYSLDDRAVNVPDLPNVLCVVSLGGGARFFSQMTDRDVNNLKIGMPMEITFRRIQEGLGVYSYFWKAKPARE